MTRLDVSPDAAPLLDPLRGLIDGALARLPDVGDVRVTVQAQPALGPGHIALPAAWIDADLHVAEERGTPYALDKWRRAACAVIEGVAAMGIAGVGPSAAPGASAASSPSAALVDWRILGLALFLADRACPELALAAPDLAAAPSSTGPGEDPRVAVALALAIQALGGDPQVEIGGWIAGAPPTGARWLELVTWIFGAGLVARVGGPVEPAVSRDIPLDLAAWSWARLDVPAHPRGGRVACEGATVVAQAWAHGGERLRTVAGALASGGRLLPDAGFPLGAWDCVSARGFGQIFGVRGMTWTFRADGRLELVLADAFAGSPEAVAMAEEVGTSGIVPGKWRIAGPSRIAVRDLDTTSIAMHGRGDQRFAVPAGPLGMGQVLQAMQASTFGFELRDGELYLRGPLMGGEIELRLRRS